MTASPPAGNLTTVGLRNILRLPEMQPRIKGCDRATVDRYEKAMRSSGTDNFPPITLALFNGSYILVDGWHRMDALERLGEWQTIADVRIAKSLAEARLWAFQANQKHGLPLTDKDRREMFRAYITSRAHHMEIGRARRIRLKSYREMEEELGLPKSTLARWMRQDFPAVARSLAERDGSPAGMRGGKRTGAKLNSLASSARKSLDAAAAAIPGVTEATDRFELLQKARAIVEILEHGPLEEPLF